MGAGTVEVRHFELMRALAEHGSLSAVARLLGYSQPAISQQVRLLETQLGTPLVVRGQKGVVLTEAGRVLLRHSASVLDTVSLAQAEVAAVAGLRTGRVRIAAFPSSAPIVANAMGHMTRAYPGVTFTLSEAEPPRAIELLESGACDIAVVFRYSMEEPLPHDEDLLVTSLLRSEVRVALPADHPLAAASTISLQDLRSLRWIAGCQDCRGHLVHACERAGFAPDIAFETDDYVALQRLAALGLGVALLPDLALAAVQVDDLCIRSLSETTFQQVAAITTSGLARVPGVHQTLQAMIGAAKNLDGTAIQEHALPQVTAREWPP